MSFSSAVSYESTSSSSESSETGSFSPSASFSSQSTIRNSQYYTQPFSKPEYNYFWVENKSKSNPEVSYYYNVKSHSVVWNRPVPKTVPLPTYSAGWVPLEKKTLSDLEDVIVVSEEETPLQRRKRLRIRKRNRQFFLEDQESSIKILSKNKTIRSKKSLETFWKLFRLPGETVEEIRKRLLTFPSDVKVENTPIVPDNPAGSIDIIGGAQIKQEPMSEDDALEVLEFKRATPELNSDSDSDPEGVSALIKQEYATNYEFEDSENQEEEEQEEEIADESEQGFDSFEESADSEEEQKSHSGSSKVYTTRAKKAQLESNPESPKDNDPEDDRDEGYIALDDFCNVEIVEGDTLDEASGEEDQVNWTFERRPNEALTINNLSFNPLHKNFQVKRKRRQKKKAHKVVTVKEEPVEEVLDPDGPIICDMYGTRTVNYNHPVAMKIPSWQGRSRLSDESSSSGNEMEPVWKSRKTEVNLSLSKGNENNDARALELKNWFPKKKRARRVRNFRGSQSESSWCASSDSLSSSCSDTNGRKKISLKRNKNFTNKKNTDSMFVDLSIVKKEKPSEEAPQVEETEESLQNNAKVSKETSLNNINAGADVYTSDSDDSSSSSCSCSQSSCSCKSLSSTEDENLDVASKVDENQDNACKLDENLDSDSKVNKNQDDANKVDENQDNTSKVDGNPDDTSKLDENQDNACKVDENLDNDSKVNKNQDDTRKVDGNPNDACKVDDKI